MWSNDKLLHMTNVPYMLPYCDLRCFDANSILSRFMHFCVEQNLIQASCLWSKNEKFHVCVKGDNLAPQRKRGQFVTTL